MTTYDDVWESFRVKCKIDDLDLPTSEEAIYATIQDAIRAYNVRMEDELKGDNSSETLSRELSGNELLLLSHCIRLIILENQLVYFSGTFNPFSKEIGSRNLANQMIRLEDIIKREEEKINSIILMTMDDFL